MYKPLKKGIRCYFSLAKLRTPFGGNFWYGIEELRPLPKCSWFYFPTENSKGVEGDQVMEGHVSVARHMHGERWNIRINFSRKTWIEAVTRELSVDRKIIIRLALTRKRIRGFWIWLRKRTSSFSKVTTNFLRRNLLPRVSLLLTCSLT
jgi:hypothetical protein